MVRERGQFEVEWEVGGFRLTPSRVYSFFLAKSTSTSHHHIISVLEKKTSKQGLRSAPNQIALGPFPISILMSLRAYRTKVVARGCDREVPSLELVAGVPWGVWCQYRDTRCDTVERGEV
jgi:hypothetical protein